MDHPAHTAQADQDQAARHDRLTQLALDSGHYRQQLLAQGFTARESIDLVIAWQEREHDGPGQ